MAKDLTYTNGVIAVREKFLLKDKILKLCEADASEALRVLSESGFGKDAPVASVYDYEKLVAADEAAIDAFIREYSPSQAEREYLLSPRDFHNAKALVKAVYLNLDAEKLLAPDGLIPADKLLSCIREKNLQPLNPHLREAVLAAENLFSEGGEASGAEIGMIFEKAQFAHLSAACAKNLLLKKLVAVKADMTNILTALRCDGAEYAEKCFVSGGKLSRDLLLRLTDKDKSATDAFKNTPYGEFVKKCFESVSASLPLTQAEKLYESYEAEYFAANRYDLKRNQPFLYYVFRRRAENANVRILFVCLLAGMRDTEIKRRLRAVI